MPLPRAEARQMRTTRAFILRLLIDSDDPQALRGAVHSVDSAEEHTFSSGPALLTWLVRMAGSKPRNTQRVNQHNRAQRPTERAEERK